MLMLLQALSAKMGCVTGLDLAQMNRAHLPRWMNIFLYIIAEAAIVCADIGQVSILRHRKATNFNYRISLY
jgi:metal iron transporter